MSIIIQYYSKTINYAKKQFHKTTNRNTYPTFLNIIYNNNISSIDIFYKIISDGFY